MLPMPILPKKRVFVFFLLSLLFACEKDDPPIVDCAQSDLSLSILNTVNADCGAPGSITAEASGGRGSYRFSINGIDYQSSATLTGLAAGTYTVTVQDGLGCFISDVATIAPEPGSLTVGLTISESSCGINAGEIEVTVAGGSAPFQYALNNGPFQSENVFESVTNGLNTIDVRDADGCQVSKSEVVSSGVRLSSDIMPIIAANCAVTGCHNGSRSPDMRTKEGIMSNANKIKNRTSAGTMPPAARPDLTASQIAIIACWVDDGAKDN